MSKTRMLLISTALAAAVAAVPATPAAAAGLTFNYRTSGLNASALLSDVPESPVAGTEYHDIFVGGGQNRIRDNGTSTHLPYAFIDELVYSFDEQGNFVFLSESFGEVISSAVSWSADRRLTAASVSANVPLDACDGNGNCTPTGHSIALDVQWTGYGPISRSRDTFHSKSDGINYTSHSSGTQRPANVVSGFAGSVVFAEIDNSTFADRCVGSGC